MLFSIYTNVKNMIMGEFKNYSEFKITLCFIFLFHNVIGFYYVVFLLHNYLPLLIKNMHSVEWL